MKLNGTPNFISSSAWFDGADFKLITLCEGCTISRETRFLTHDWSMYNVSRAVGDSSFPAKSSLRPILVGEYCFIGASALLMPGTSIGKGSIVGAGSVVRGTIPDYSIVMGNPGTVVGDSREYYNKNKDRFLAD